MPNVPTITRDALAEGIEHGRFLLIDVLPATSYARGHIPGAVNVPLERLASLETPRDLALVVYCASET